MSKKPPAFQFYASDFLAGTQDMTCEEVGAYIRLLCMQWDRGALPSDPARIQVLTGCTADACAFVMQKFRINGAGLMQNARMEEIRAEQQRYRESRAKNGKKKWENCTADAPEMHMHQKSMHNGCTADAPPTHNACSPTPTPIYTPLPPEGDESGEFQLDGDESKPKRDIQSEAEEIYRAYPKKVAKDKTIAAIVKSLKECPFEELLAKTQAYARAKAGGDPQYTLHSLTFFNQKRFNDDPATWASGGWNTPRQSGQPEPPKKRRLPTPDDLAREWEEKNRQ